MKKYFLLLSFFALYMSTYAQMDIGEKDSIIIDIDLPADSFSLEKYTYGLDFNDSEMQNYYRASMAYDSIPVYHKCPSDTNIRDNFGVDGDVKMGCRSFLLRVVIPRGSRITSCRHQVLERNLLFKDFCLPFGVEYRYRPPWYTPPEYPSTGFLQEESRLLAYNGGEKEGYYSWIDVRPFYYDIAMRALYLSKMRIICEVEQEKYNDWDTFSENAQEIVEDLKQNSCNDNDVDRFYPVGLTTWKMADTTSIVFDLDFPAEYFQKVKSDYTYDRVGKAFDSTLVFTPPTDWEWPSGMSKNYYFGANLFYNVSDVCIPGFYLILVVPLGYEISSINFEVKERQLLFQGIRFPVGYDTGRTLGYHSHFEEYPNDTIVEERARACVEWLFSRMITVCPFYYDARKREVYLSKVRVKCNLIQQYVNTWNPSAPDMETLTKVKRENRFFNWWDVDRFYPVETGIHQMRVVNGPLHLAISRNRTLSYRTDERSGVQELEIRDIQGRRMARYDITESGQIQLSVIWPPGIYVCTLKTDGRVVDTKKILVK